MTENTEDAILEVPYLKAALFYFSFVFGAGFVLGVIRTLWLVPRVGVRTAELLETPLMVLATALVARRMIQHFNLPDGFSPRFATGALALSFLISAELALVVGLQGMTVSEYIASRDPISGTAYLMALGVFAFMPTLVLRDRHLS